MTDAASNFEFERLLSDALHPVDPPPDLPTRMETAFASIAELAAAELSNWADELSESEVDALRDPRNWVRPVVAVAAGTVAGGALVLLELRRRRRPSGLRASAESLLKDLRPD